MGRHWPSFMYLLSGMIHSVSNYIRVLGILRLLIGYILLRSIWTWCVLGLWTYVIKNYMVGDQIKRLGRISVLFLQNTAGEASASFFFCWPRWKTASSKHCQDDEGSGRKSCSGLPWHTAILSLLIICCLKWSFWKMWLIFYFYFAKLPMNEIIHMPSYLLHA